MTSKYQRIMLFGLWNRVAKASGWSAKEADLQRAEFTMQALEINGRTALIPSWSDLTNRQVDKLKSSLNAAIGALPLVASPAGAESPEDAAERTRLVFGINTDMTAAYGDAIHAMQAIATICAKVFGQTHFSALGRWVRLELEDLRNLRRTAAHRRRSKFAKTGGYIDESRSDW